MASSDTACRKKGPKRLWTLKAYAGLTRDLRDRFSGQELRCAAFQGTDLDPDAVLDSLQGAINDLTDEEDTTSWIRGVVAALIVIWGYVNKVRTGRIYRLILRRFIIITLLIEALHAILEGLIRFLEQLIVVLAQIEEVRALFTCKGVDVDGN